MDSVSAVDMTVVTEAGPTEAAMIEAPIRMYVTENNDSSADLVMEASHFDTDGLRG